MHLNWGLGVSEHIEYADLGNTGNLLHRLFAAEKLLEKHETDLYRGNGKPGVTMRLNDLEREVVCNGKPTLTVRLNNLEEDMQDRQKRDSRLQNYVMTTLFLMLATLFTLIGNLISKHL